MSDKIEFRMRFDNLDIDMSDPKNLTTEEFQKIWAHQCLKWQDKILTGKMCHYCPDWDYLPIDETCMEYEACNCEWRKEHEKL